MTTRIGVACDQRPVAAVDDQFAEWDTPTTIAWVTAQLRALAFDVVLLGAPADALRCLPHEPRCVDIVLSMAEGRASRTREAWVPSLCDILGIPYVGSAARVLALSLDKHMTKRVWQESGLAVPMGVCVAEAAVCDSALRVLFPAIVKPRYEGSGMGIDAAAIVHTRAALRKRVAWAIAHYRQPVIVESFIRGQEITVCLLGDPLVALPPVQRHVDPVTSLSCHIAPSDAPVLAPVSSEIEEASVALAMRAVQALRARDMARVDLRIDERGQPWLLEVNLVPALGPDSSFALLAETLGWGGPGLFQRLIAPTLRRGGLPKNRTGSIFWPARTDKIEPVPFSRS